MSILIGLCVSVLVGLAFGYVVSKANENEIDAHEEITKTTNRTEWDSNHDFN